MKPLGTDDKFIKSLLRKPQVNKLWNSVSGQRLVQDTHPKQHRLLAQYFFDWVHLTEIHEKMQNEEAEGRSSLTTIMKSGEGGEPLLVEHPLQKILAKTEKRIRDAETKLGLTIKDLENAPAQEDEDVPDFGS